MGDDVEKQSFNKDRTRFSIENDAKQLLDSINPERPGSMSMRTDLKMQSLMLDVLLDIRDELRDKSSIGKWGPKI